MQKIEDPAISNIPEGKNRVCCECGEGMLPWADAYEIERGEWVCEECFKDFVSQLDVYTLADALNINHLEVYNI